MQTIGRFSTLARTALERQLPGRTYASAAAGGGTGNAHKVVIVGAGSAGCTIAHQLLKQGTFASGDISVVDPAAWHHYQPGWTLVGAGLKDKSSLRRSMDSIIDPRLTHYKEAVTGFAPEQNTVKLASGRALTYENLIVVPGIEVKFDKVKGLPELLADREAPVGSIYSYEYCDKTYDVIRNFNSGKALFTQPAGMLKCAGAPQKILWLALDHWKQNGLYNIQGSGPIEITFASGLHQMFGVQRYSDTLEELRKERAVNGFFSYDLKAIEGNTARFEVVGKPDEVHDMSFDMLHVVPPMGAWDFVASSPLANGQGMVNVDQGTMQHVQYPNVWSAGDASSLPTSKTAAAITAQAPILVHNLMQADKQKPLDASYDGYTSCPIPTEYGKLLLAEFAYQGVPTETFKSLVDQSKPQRPFYYLKKDFFPWVYFNYMLQGNWAGPKGFARS